MAMYDDDNIANRSFDLSYISEHLIQAQWAEFVELKKRISELVQQQGRPISILDIGVGNGRIPMHLGGVKEMWDMISAYDGTDNAQNCIDTASDNIAQKNIQDKVTATLFDAVNLNEWPKKYDMVLITWFTAGNFYPPGFDFENYGNSNVRLDLSYNPTFDKIFNHAYNLLLPGGKIVIGACYVDNESTRIKQEASYQKMGMQVITNASDTFTATKEGFWSQRFTKEKLYKYLHFAEPGQIDIIPLDTYNYAMQVVVTKS